MNNNNDFLEGKKIDWSLWEIYRAGIAIKDYESSIKKLIKINSLKDFYELALFIPHFQPSKLFYDREARAKPKFPLKFLIKIYFFSRYKVKIDNKEDFVLIDSICLFKGDIPPLTENNKNIRGGAHYYMFGEMKASQIDQLWLSLTTSLITNDGIENSEIINGLRFCDKTKTKESAMQLRLEVWTETDFFQKEHFDFHTNIKKDIQSIIKENGLEVKHTYKAHNSQD